MGLIIRGTIPRVPAFPYDFNIDNPTKTHGKSIKSFQARLNVCVSEKTSCSALEARLFVSPQLRQLGRNCNLLPPGEKFHGTFFRGEKKRYLFRVGSMAYGDELVLVDDFFHMGPSGFILLVRNLPFRKSDSGKSIAAIEVPKWPEI